MNPEGLINFVQNSGRDFTKKFIKSSVSVQ